MATVTCIKYMTKEELINMLLEIHRFSMKSKEGKNKIIDKRIDEFKPEYITFSNVKICNRATAFKLDAFDMEDCLKCGEGYVRYNSFGYYKRLPKQAEILIERYGFSIEG